MTSLIGLWKPIHPQSFMFCEEEEAEAEKEEKNKEQVEEENSVNH